MSASRLALTDRMVLTHRHARAVLVAVHLPFAAVAPIVTGWGLPPEPADDVRAVPVLGLLLLAVQLEHSVAAARGRTPRAWPLTFVILLAGVYVPMQWFGVNWASTQWFVVASAAMLLPRWLAVPFIAGPILGTAVWAWDHALDLGATDADAAYVFVSWIAGLTVGGICLYATVEMVRAVDALFATRADLADVAVGTERQRLSRDLHDLLGQTLTAVSLKGELALALLPSDPGAAETEIRGLTAAARDAVHAMRDVAQGEHRASLQAELAGAEALLSAAGIATDVDVVVGPLAPPADEVLGWAVREGVTNLLRHSRASRCSIIGRVDGGDATLEILNDGRVGPAGHGHGLTGLAERAAAIGGRAGVMRTGDSHRLLVRVPHEVPA